jgi:hypothetical protein
VTHYVNPKHIGSISLEPESQFVATAALYIIGRELIKLSLEVAQELLNQLGISDAKPAEAGVRRGPSNYKHS